MAFNDSEFKIDNDKNKNENKNKATISIDIGIDEHHMQKLTNENIIKQATYLGNSWYQIGDKYYHIVDETVFPKIFTKQEYEDATNTSTDNNEEKQKEEEKEEEIISNIANAHKKDKVEAMNKFKKVLDKLNTKFNHGRAIYTMYFKMVLYNGNVLVDSTSSDWAENVLIDFTHEMNGSGQANKFTLTLCFKSSDRNTYIKINDLEAKILANCMIFKSNSEINDDENKLFNNCRFQYGYADGFYDDLISPMYNGMILDYNCKLDNGLLKYTINGVCGLYASKEYRISPKEEYLTDSSGAKIEKPLDYIRRIFEVEFETTNLYEVKFLNIPDTSKIIFPGNDFKQFEQKNIFSVLEDILNGCMTEEQYNETVGKTEEKNNDATDTLKEAEENMKMFYPTQKQLFGYYVTDEFEATNTGRLGTVYVYKLDNLNTEENRNGTATPNVTADANINFSWFGPVTSSPTYNHLVKDWSPSYQGSALAALAVNLSKGKQLYNTMTDDGDITQVFGLGGARLGINNDDKNRMIISTIQEYSNWSFITQYPYKANMTILGAPCEVPLTAIIGVRAFIGEQEHHSSGAYVILKKTDRINSSGFFTEFELFKFVTGYNPEYMKINSLTNEDSDENAKLQIEDKYRKAINEADYQRMLGNITDEEYQSRLDRAEQEKSGAQHRLTN